MYNRGRRVVLVLTREEFEALLRGELKLRRDLKICFRKFKIKVDVKKLIKGT